MNAEKYFSDAEDKARHKKMVSLVERMLELHSPTRPPRYLKKIFSPARMGTFKRFSAGVIGQDHISL